MSMSSRLSARKIKKYFFGKTPIFLTRDLGSARCQSLGTMAASMLVQSLLLYSTAARAMDPDSAAKSVIKAIVGTDPSTSEFALWKYGNGIITAALINASEALGDDAPMAWVNDVLDGFITDPSNRTGYAQQLLDNETVPWPPAIGDTLGLYPMAYLRRAEYYYSRRSAPKGYNLKRDLEIATRTANRYILGWPTRWADGTVTREVSGSWKQNETNTGEFVWGDDAFMGLVLVARLSRTPINDEDLVPAWRRRAYVDFTAAQALLITSKLASSDGLYFHGVNARTGATSCCKWGRANGWTIMAKAEVLLSLSADHPARSALLTAYRSHVDALVAVQSVDGRWHQLLNDTSEQSYLETSVTAMTAWSIATGIARGWISGDASKGYRSVVDRAWEGLARTVQPDGTVEGICDGFGIHNSAQDYYGCPTEYNRSTPGLGSVIRAALATSALGKRWQR